MENGLLLAKATTGFLKTAANIGFAASGADRRKFSYRPLFGFSCEPTITHRTFWLISNIVNSKGLTAGLTQY
jgi:hypothetical protein